MSIINTKNQPIKTYELSEEIKIWNIYNVTITNNTASYYRFINLNSQQYKNLKQNKDVRKNLWKHVFKSICDDKNIKTLLSYNIDLYFQYDIDNSQVFNGQILKKDCN